MQRVRLDKDWIAPTRWSCIMEFAEAIGAPLFNGNGLENTSLTHMEWNIYSNGEICSSYIIMHILAVILPVSF